MINRGYFIQRTLHPINCNSCCKSYCTNCYSISILEINELILAIENQLAYNSNNWMVRIKYDFKDCYSQEKQIIGSVYLRFLNRYRASLINNAYQYLKKKEINSILENIKDFIDLCPEDEQSLTIDRSGYEQWATLNPERAALPEWEFMLPSDYKLDHYLVKEYDSLTDCNISYEIYKNLIDCNISHELIKEFIGCNMITKSSISEDSCLININRNSYELCDLKVKSEIKEKLITDLIEIKLIEE